MKLSPGITIKLFMSPSAVAETRTQSQRIAPHVQAGSRAPVPLWLWWNVLCLDAPAVALGWHLLAIRELKAQAGAASAFVLSAIVWSIYVVDHWLDSRHGRNQRARHAFMQRGGKYMVPLAAAAIIACAVMAVSLPPPIVRNGILLSLVTLAYMTAAHHSRSVWAREVAVGVVFAAGSLLPALSTSSLTTPLAAAAVVYAAICVLNCVLIEVRESCNVSVPHVRQASVGLQNQDSVHWSTRWIGTHGRIVGAALCASAALLALLTHGNATWIFVALAMSAFFLVALYGLRARMNASLFRVLADTALLTPFVLLAVR
jgi:hypothetical protein